jgi:hypothetical protein
MSDDTLAKRAYITNLGRSTWALVNTYYAVLREKQYFPDNVYIFTERTYKPELEKAKAAINILSEEFEVQPDIQTKVVHDWDFLAAGKEIFGTVKKFKENGYEVAIDITPGRKALVVASLISGIKVNIDYVFYLAIRSTDDAAKPYMMIPRQIQNIRDFMADARKVVG